MFQFVILGNKTNDHTLLRITDNGSGIREEELESIFIPFYTNRENGSGVGLSLSRQIMKMHGGSISVRSTFGEGAEFTLTF
jgi:signal transduction histidine kinase